MQQPARNISSSFLTGSKQVGGGPANPFLKLAWSHIQKTNTYSAEHSLIDVGSEEVLIGRGRRKRKKKQITLNLQPFLFPLWIWASHVRTRTYVYYTKKKWVTIDAGRARYSSCCLLAKSENPVFASTLWNLCHRPRKRKVPLRSDKNQFFLAGFGKFWIITAKRKMSQNRVTERQMDG